MKQKNIIYRYAAVLATVFGVSAAQAATTNTDVTRSMYQDECGSCHMAYPAWLLPSQSWLKIMTNLENHYGDNASLDAETLKTLSEYLVANSAEKSGNRRAGKMLRNTNDADIPIRITELPYFIHEHDEIPDRLIKANPKVKSISNCIACHKGAEQGSFNEHQVRIPGFGRWDD